MIVLSLYYGIVSDYQVLWQIMAVFSIWWDYNSSIKEYLQMYQQFHYSSLIGDNFWVKLYLCSRMRHVISKQVNIDRYFDMINAFL